MDTGGAGPITGLLEAKRMIEYEGADLVAVCAGDAVKSMSTESFLSKADMTCKDPESNLKSPVIPNGYDRVAQYQIERGFVTREQLAMCAVIMSIMASRHPQALTRSVNTLEEVLSSTPVGSVTNVLECARRADGGACVLVASSSFMSRRSIAFDDSVVVIGGGEASGPLYPPTKITEDMFSCEEASLIAYEESHVSVKDIDFFGLYDCFPICLLRALEGSCFYYNFSGWNSGKGTWRCIYRANL